MFGFKERSVRRAFEGVAPYLLAEERPLGAFPASAGLNPVVVLVPVAAFIVSQLFFRSDPPRLALAVAAFGFALLGRRLTKLRRVVVTDRRILVCTVKVFGRIAGIDRESPLAAVSVVEFRPGTPQCSMSMIFHPAVTTWLWIPRVWEPEARDLLARIGAATSTLPPPPPPI